MISSIASAFCDHLILKGEPLSYTGQVLGGLPLVKPYDGEKYCGASCHNVVRLDLRKQTPGMFTVQKGGKINVAKIGTTIIIDRILIDKEPIFTTMLEPAEGGWNITDDRYAAKAQVLNVYPKYVEAQLI